MQEPVKPDPLDCCNSGCTPCILDVYEEQLKKYRKSLNDNNVPNNCISKTSYSVFKLVNIERHSKDTLFYSFEYCRPEKDAQSFENKPAILYNPGQHFIIKATHNGETFSRAYTPIYSENDTLEIFTVLVKLYTKGKMSNYFRNLKIGAATLWRGPYGDYEINYNEKNLLLIAQGTGIAPVYTILCSLLDNEDCYTKVKLLFCCDSENLLLREKLHGLSHFWNFKYELFINKKVDNFQEKYNEVIHFGKLDVNELRQCLNSHNTEEMKVLICGGETFCQYMKECSMECGINNIFIF